MEKIKFGYKLWTVIIVFLLIHFIFNAVSKASLFYAGSNLLVDNQKTFLSAGIYLISTVCYSLIDKFFNTYVIQKYINKRVVENLGYAVHKMNNMSIKQHGRNIGSGKYLSSIFQNFYFPFYGQAIQVFFLSDVVLNLILNLAFFFYFNLILGVVTLSGIVIFLILPLFFYKTWLYYWDKIADQTNNQYEKMLQLFKFFNFYYVYRRTNKILDEVQDKLKEVKMTQKKFTYSNILYFGLYHTILYGCQIAFYLISGFAIVNLATDANQIVGLAFFSISSLPEVLTKTASFSGTFSNFWTKKKIYAKFWKFTDGDHYPEDQLTTYEQPFQSINIQGLKFNYPDKPAIYTNFNLTIEKNKKYLVIGNNGSGKSTLTKLFTGFERDYSGNILFNNDIQVKELKQESLCHYFNWVTNKNILLDDTLRNNLTLYKNDISDDQIKSSLATVNLSELDQLDHTYEEGKNGLSVGQVQRLDIARCLLEPKPILILDEALSNVDVSNQERILDHFLSQKDLTLIVITHHLTAEWQQKFDQVIQL